MELDVLETAMTELANEQKTTSQLVGDLTARLNAVEGKIDSFDEKLKNIQVAAPLMNNRPIISLLAAHTKKVTEILEAQPKNVVHQKRWLLFPETNAEFYYRVVFGRIFGWCVLIMLILFAMNLGEEYIHSYDTKVYRRYHYEVYEDAWGRLDTTLTPSGRKKMHEAMDKAIKDQK